MDGFDGHSGHDSSSDSSSSGGHTSGHHAHDATTGTSHTTNHSTSDDASSPDILTLISEIQTLSGQSYESGSPAAKRLEKLRRELEIARRSHQIQESPLPFIGCLFFLWVIVGIGLLIFHR
jgi:hypothetical protein